MYIHVCTHKNIEAKYHVQVSQGHSQGGFLVAQTPLSLEKVDGVGPMLVHSYLLKFKARALIIHKLRALTLSQGRLGYKQSAAGDFLAHEQIHRTRAISHPCTR